MINCGDTAIDRHPGSSQFDMSVMGEAGGSVLGGRLESEKKSFVGAVVAPKQGDLNAPVLSPLLVH